jgi:hypothetical protein
LIEKSELMKSVARRIADGAVLRLIKLSNHQWRKNPPGELSIDPVADEWLVRVTTWVGAS